MISANLYGIRASVENEKKILLALSTTRQSQKTIEHALNFAKKEAASLIALFVIDPDLPELIFSKLIDIGFMGEKPGEEVMKALLKEYRIRGDEKLKEIKKLAEKKGIECKTILKTGNFAKECLKIINEQKPLLVVLTRAKRSNISRFLFGSAVNEIKKKSSAPIKIIKED